MYQRYTEVCSPSYPAFYLPFSYQLRDWEYYDKDLLTNFSHDMSCQVLRELERPILYSLSPGTSVTPAMAKDVSGLVNMYRITGDDWDKWEDVKAHFDVTR